MLLDRRIGNYYLNVQKKKPVKVSFFSTIYRISSLQKLAQFLLDNTQIFAQWHHTFTVASPAQNAAFALRCSPCPFDRLS